MLSLIAAVSALTAPCTFENAVYEARTYEVNGEARGGEVRIDFQEIAPALPNYGTAQMRVSAPILGAPHLTAVQSMGRGDVMLVETPPGPFPSQAGEPYPAIEADDPAFPYYAFSAELEPLSRRAPTVGEAAPAHLFLPGLDAYLAGATPASYQELGPVMFDLVECRAD